ncbi:phosphotransferase [Oceanobacillus halotolerans]|uniref:phosphotransferase n=1 Tax=Oceanobacillus halotolerans TaxID=2663380 RepID=UPI00384A8D6E
MKLAFSKEWKVTPAGGLTGDAYIAETTNRRLFVKRNSSPFLAVLSAEGIVPKLVWTRRMENGDVITAQEYLDARELKPEEMQHEQVATLLYKIHHSTELLHMLMRLGKKPLTTDERLMSIKQRLNRNEFYSAYPEVEDALHCLEMLLPVTRNQKQVVCHCDLNHNNLLLTKQGHLYLIDWDNAMIADPVMDFGLLLKSYIPRDKWEEWLNNYGVTYRHELVERMYWYLILDALQYFSWHMERHEYDKAWEQRHQLEELTNYVKETILI